MKPSRSTTSGDPCWAICGACQHAFVFAYAPMLLDKFIVCLKRATCPRCGETKRLFACDHEPTAEELAGLPKGKGA